MKSVVLGGVFYCYTRLLAGRILVQKENNSIESDNQRILIEAITPEIKSVNVSFNVLQIGEVRQVRAKFSGQLHEVVDALVADESGQISLTLWNDEIDMIEVNKCYSLTRGYVTMHNYSMRLSKGQYGTIIPSDMIIEKLNELKDMSRPFAWKKPKKRKQSYNPGKSFSGKRGRETKGYCSRKTF